MKHQNANNSVARTHLCSSEIAFALLRTRDRRWILNLIFLSFLASGKNSIIRSSEQFHQAGWDDDFSLLPCFHVAINLSRCKAVRFCRN